MIWQLLLLAWFFQPAPTYTVSGTVVNRVDGKPLSGARVTLGGRPADPEVTGVDGKFRFTGVKQGKFPLAAEKVGFGRQSYRQRSLMTNLSTGIVTGEGQPTENLVFGMIPGGVIAGSVSDTQGNPVTGMSVLVYRVVGVGDERRAELQLFGDRTDDQGRYRIAPLPSGSFVVAFTGWTARPAPTPVATTETYPVTYYPGTTVAARAALVRVEPGQEVRADAILAPKSRVRMTGKVVLPDFPEGGWVSVNAAAPYGGEVGLVRAMVIGSQFVLDGVPEGQYVVNLDNDQGRRVARSMVDVGTSDVTVTLGETPFAHVLEIVELRGEARNPNASTILRLQSKNVRAERTLDSDGRAEIAALPPGQYEVYVTKGQSLMPLSVTAKGAILRGGILDIPASGEISVTIVADASPQRNVPGRVLRGDKPEGGLLALLVPKNNWQNLAAYRVDQSDSDGTFAWRGVAPGEYLMFAFEDGEPSDYASSEVIAKLAPKGQEVTITGDARQAVVVHVTAR